MGDNDDKPRRSWRDVDKRRAQSSHHGDQERTSSHEQRLQRSGAYRAYKRQLDNLFTGGVVPDALKEKLADSGVVGHGAERKEMRDALLGARTPKKIREALSRYRETCGFPADEEVLAKLLDLEDEGIVLETLQTLERIHTEQGLTRANSLKARIKTVQMMVDDDDVQDVASRLLKQL